MPRGLFADSKGRAAVAPGAAKGIETILGDNRVAAVQGLSKMDRRIVRAGGPSIFIYNVSTVFDWKRPIQGRSRAFIPKCKAGELVSEALEIPPFVVRDFDKGNRNRSQLPEEGKDIAEDILGCSTEYPGLPVNNLTNYGCFYLVGKRFEELPEKERQKILDEANDKHDNMCRTKVLEGDQLHSAGHSHWLTEMYRLCALHLQIRFKRENWARDWVARRGGSTVETEDCVFCGYSNKRGVVKCQNCHEILSQEAYDKLIASRKSKAQAEA
jgi:hypothetical protein